MLSQLSDRPMCSFMLFHSASMAVASWRHAAEFRMYTTVTSSKPIEVDPKRNVFRLLISRISHGATLLQLNPTRIYRSLWQLPPALQPFEVLAGSSASGSEVIHTVHPALYFWDPWSLWTFWRRETVNQLLGIWLMEKWRMFSWWIHPRNIYIYMYHICMGISILCCSGDDQD